MSGGRTILHLLTKAAIGLGALFLVGVLLAAIPNHRTPVVASVTTETVQEAQQSGSTIETASMPEMDMADVHASEHTAMADMATMHHGNTAHMQMTVHRAAAPGDEQRAMEIEEKLRSGIEKYKDYHVALNEGFKIFLPNVPQAEYHFTNYANGFLEAFAFDPARPTSLLYKKTSGGYELVGAMYTMPKRATEEELNERVPLSMATWHLHTNLCMPPKGQMRPHGLDQVWIEGIDLHASRLRRGRRTIHSSGIRLDDTCVSIRVFAEQDLRDASSGLIDKTLQKWCLCESGDSRGRRPHSLGDFDVGAEAPPP